MPAPKKEPEWVARFLVALGSCGNVTRAASLAGIDTTGPYNRRNRYPEFKGAWVRVLAEREMRAALPASAALPSPSHSVALSRPLPLPQRGEGLEGGKVVVGASCDGVKMSRVAGGRWSEGTEEGFLEHLSATANVALAAAAVGFSAASAYRRRMRDARFAERWAAAMEVGRAQLESHLLVRANQAFDPDALPIADGAPKVTVGEAISILKHQPGGGSGKGGGQGGGRVRARAAGYMDWVTDDDVDMMEQAAAARASIYDKLERLREQDEERRLAAGYTRHGEDWIPPGWVWAGEAGAGQA